jgi:hypothetical protein
MLVKKSHLKQALLLIVSQRIEQGADIRHSDFVHRIESASDSYDALYAIALELRSPPMRQDWRYCEPVVWDDIVAESEHLKPHAPWDTPDLDTAAANVHAAFLASVCGCMLGKPVEINPSLAELKQAGEAAGEWPIQDYISLPFLEELGRRHESATQTSRENIQFVAADDDIHYTLIGMLLLEQSGLSFDEDNLYTLWSMNMPPLWTWGPERTALLTGGINHHHIFTEQGLTSAHDVLLLNPGDELCGAVIRADAYGYACPGNPDLAAWLAWKDASYTHIKTGVYATMFVAALIALCQVADNRLRGNDRLEIVKQALKRVPSNTRFSAVVRDSLQKIAVANDWLSGYESIHKDYHYYTHCMVYQEVGTLINTLKFADSVHHGICIQVSQGNDTDSFGATAGSMLGCFFGPGHLDERWLRPFNNKILHSLADFHEYELSAVARRMERLPARVFDEFNAPGKPR